MPHCINTAENIGIVLVGGPSTSTSFRPLGLQTPKALFPICDKPILEHQLKWLAKSKLFSHLFVLGFFENQPFDSFIQKLDSEITTPIKYLREYENLGTAGGMYHFRDVLLRSKPKRILVFNSDTMTLFDLHELVTFHDRSKSDFTIVCSQVKPEQAANFGAIVVDSTGNGKVRHFVEKPHSFISNTVNCGIYMMNANVMNFIGEQYRLNEKNSERPQFMMFERDIIPALLEMHSIYSFSDILYWKLVKTPSSVLDCCATLLENGEADESSSLNSHIIGNCKIHPTARIDENARIGPNVVISEGCIVKSGACIKNSIIMPNVTVDDSAFISNSIIGQGSSIGRWARIEGYLSDSNNLLQGKKQQPISVLSAQNLVFQEVVLRNCIVLPNKELKSNCFNEVIM